MARFLPSLSGLRTFEAAARHKSFKQAASELNVTESAVSHQIRNLEVFLNATLFRRLARGVELTDSGEEYYSVIKNSFDLIERATEKCANKTQNDMLIIYVIVSFSVLWLIPRLSAFSAANPDVDVRIMTSYRPVNFAKQDVDVAICVGRLPGVPADPRKPQIRHILTEDWGGIHADFLAHDVLVPVCSAALKAGRPCLENVDDIRHHTLLHTSTRMNAWPDWLRCVGAGWTPGESGLSYSHFFMAMEEAANGRGIAIAPYLFVENYVATKRLVMPFDFSTLSDGQYYLIYRESHSTSNKISLFRNWMLNEMGKANCGVPRHHQHILS